jgi:hypothetical protein
VCMPPRHPFNSGVDPFAVQKLAGHSDVRLTTQTYAHVQADALRRAVGVLDRIGWGRRRGHQSPSDHCILRGWWGDPWGFESPLRCHAGIRRASGKFRRPFSIQQPAKAR